LDQPDGLNQLMPDCVGRKESQILGNVTLQYIIAAFSVDFYENRLRFSKDFILIFVAQPEQSFRRNGFA